MRPWLYQVLLSSMQSYNFKKFAIRYIVQQTLLRKINFLSVLSQSRSPISLKTTKQVNAIGFEKE